MKLYVIRHGEVDVNAKGLLNGRNDSILNAKGIKQASEILKNIHFDFIICSPLKRTIETAKIININNKNIIYEDCEGFKSVFTRVANFIEDIKKHYKNKTILVVTHGDVCKAIYSYLNHISDISEIINFQQDNGEVLYYEI